MNIDEITQAVVKRIQQNYYLVEKTKDGRFKLFPDSAIILERTVEFVCDSEGMSQDAIRNSSNRGRFRGTTEIQHIIYYLIRKYFSHKVPLKMLGGLFGRHHTTVYQGAANCETIMSSDPRFKARVLFLESGYKKLFEIK